MKIEIRSLAIFVAVFLTATSVVVKGDLGWFMLGIGMGISLGIIVGDL